ncbi:gamma-glutamyl-gamma-aminobutyrate hydrolase family protein [Lagierella sp.]|uniref:gamma-glutamyl-gamma-aminobutyrate hydrolase family protein n=1 Tax=Lagierella sp. TaxID=2849657 RepID=UPI00262B4318|nr:gamma-glutamyl-gamma-aminobutyrate hydrolase family protein [Lagierella sp.]
MTKIIGIPLWTKTEVIARQETNNSFVEKLLSLKAVPLMYPQQQDKKTMEEFIKRIDGLLLTGGADVSTVLYKEEASEELEETQYNRDIVEMGLLNMAIDKGLPIFGVCRGMQLINVAFGGTLYQDIYTTFEKPFLHSDKKNKNYEYHHMIRTVENSLLRKVLGETDYVNSIHHQAVKDIGRGLKVTAWASDNMIEGIEHESLPIFGTQFHPELDKYNDKYIKIFQAFLDMIK